MNPSAFPASSDLALASKIPLRSHPQPSSETSSDHPPNSAPQKNLFRFSHKTDPNPVFSLMPPPDLPGPHPCNTHSPSPSIFSTNTPRPSVSNIRHDCTQGAPLITSANPRVTSSCLFPPPSTGFSSIKFSPSTPIPTGSNPQSNPSHLHITCSIQKTPIHHIRSYLSLIQKTPSLQFLMIPYFISHTTFHFYILCTHHNILTPDPPPADPDRLCLSPHANRLLPEQKQRGGHKRGQKLCFLEQ